MDHDALLDQLGAKGRLEYSNALGSVDQATDFEGNASQQQVGLLLYREA